MNRNENSEPIEIYSKLLLKLKRGGAAAPPGALKMAGERVIIGKVHELRNEIDSFVVHEWKYDRNNNVKNEKHWKVGKYDGYVYSTQNRSRHWPTMIQITFKQTLELLPPCGL